MMTRRFRSLLLPCVVVAAVMAGCSLETGNTAPVVENTCSTLDDCAGALDEMGNPTDLVSCDEGAGLCVGTPDEALRIGLELTPSTDDFGETPPSVAFEDRQVSGPTERDLDFPAPITVVGNVRWVPAEGEPVRVPAELVFTRPSALPGADATQFETSTATETIDAADGMPADYSARIVSEDAYDLHVQPTGELAKLLPPLRFGGIDVPGGGDVWRLNVTYGPTETGLMVPRNLEELTGKVVSQSPEGIEMPEDGLRIRAVEVESGRVISSSGITGEDDGAAPGEFTVRLAPGAGPYVLRITAGSERPLFPTVIADPDLFFPGVESPTILVPRPEPFCFQGNVEVAGTSGDRKVEDAVVSFRSADVFDDRTQLKGSFRTTVTTQAEGAFEVDLLPGTYEVLVTPSGQEDLSVFRTEQTLGAPSGDDCSKGHIFKVETRTQVGGRVVGPDATPVVGATLDARPWRQPPGTGLMQFARSSDAVTDSTGQFALPLDVGVYDVTVKPSATEGYSWLVLEGLEIGASGGPGPSETLELQAPMPIRGVARDADGDPLAGAQVKAHAVIEDDAGGERTVVVGRAETDAEGAYELLVPSRLLSGL